MWIVKKNPATNSCLELATLIMFSCKQCRGRHSISQQLVKPWPKWKTVTTIGTVCNEPTNVKRHIQNIFWSTLKNMWKMQILFLCLIIKCVLYIEYLRKGALTTIRTNDKTILHKLSFYLSTFLILLNNCSWMSNIKQIVSNHMHKNSQTDLNFFSFYLIWREITKQL
jgi:hypothetical protein